MTRLESVRYWHEFWSSMKMTQIVEGDSPKRMAWVSKRLEKANVRYAKAYVEALNG